MNNDTVCMLHRLALAGISHHDAHALRRIAMTLHRWHELECGTDNGCIAREESDPDGGRPFWRYSSGKRGAYMPDRELGALKRLAAIMARYPDLQFYVQRDPRGASLYILRPGDVPKPVHENVENYYSRGLAVHK